MTSRPDDSTVSEEELHGFLDGQLAPERAAAVRAWLETHPETAREVETWRANDAALADLLGPFHHGDAGEVPDPAVSSGTGVSGWPAIAAAVLVAFGLGGGAGYALHGALAPGAVQVVSDSDWLGQAARDVFLTYVREVRHPVEVGADEREHLANWLGNRIERPFTAPSLDTLGFELVGGRLLPIGGNPGAMLMYENAHGDRATILLARNAGARDTAFQFSQSAGVNTFRWIDGPVAYAISGFLDRPALEDISRAVYAHFEAI